MRWFYQYFYKRLPVKKSINDSKLVILTDEEITAIKKKERTAIWLAAFFGVMGVILLYVPYYLLPDWFPNVPITLFDNTVDVPVVFLCYTVVIVAIEILLLTLLNIWCTHEVATVTGYIDATSKNTKEKTNLLLNISLDKKSKDLLNYGINPYQGLNKSALLAWNVMIILKATLSNMVFKFIIQRVLIRFPIKSIQLIQDFAGIPIFALWNAFGTKKILRESRVIIMGENVIADLARRIKADQDATEDFKSLLYQTLRFVAISKRDFHQNHYLLAKHLFELYNIEPNQGKCKKKIYLKRLQVADKEQKEVCLLIIALGFILDGQLSTREKLRIQEMRKEGVFDFTIKEMNQYNKNFVNGKGVEEIITKYI